MGQFWMEIIPVSGSVLVGHQHKRKQYETGAAASRYSAAVDEVEEAAQSSAQLRPYENTAEALGASVEPGQYSSIRDSFELAAGPAITSNSSQIGATADKSAVVNLGTVTVMGSSGNYAFWRRVGDDWVHAENALLGANGAATMTAQMRRNESIQLANDARAQAEYGKWVSNSWGPARHQVVQQNQYVAHAHAIDQLLGKIGAPFRTVGLAIDDGLALLQDGVHSWQDLNRSMLASADGPMSSAGLGALNALNQSISTFVDGGIGAMRIFSNEEYLALTGGAFEGVGGQRPSEMYDSARAHFQAMSSDELRQSALTGGIGLAFSGFGSEVEVSTSARLSNSVDSFDGFDVPKQLPDASRGPGWTPLSKNSRAYIRDIESNTGVPISAKQKSLLADALRATRYDRVSPEAAAVRRLEFNRMRQSLIDQWEMNTGREWPTYIEEVVSKSGTVLRRAGQQYDAHHIIQSSYGGPNEWWNIHPARFPEQHQGGIHRSGSPARDIFGS